MSGWTLWARKAWTDNEPDTFTMSVESSQPDSQRFVVVSGNATWLSSAQAKEVAVFLQRCIAVVDAGPTVDASNDDGQDVRAFWDSQRRQSMELGPDGFRVDI